MFYLTTHSTHFIYGYMASDMVKNHSDREHSDRQQGFHRQDNTYHSLCYTSRGAVGWTRYSSMGPPHEGSIRRPIAPWANALTTELHLAPTTTITCHYNISKWDTESSHMTDYTTHTIDQLMTYTRKIPTFIICRFRVELINICLNFVMILLKGNLLLFFVFLKPIKYEVLLKVKVISSFCTCVLFGIC